MSACTFFGHRDCPDTVKEKLRFILLELIERRNVKLFYVGHQGHFDSIVLSVLQELQLQHPEICYAVVLAYMPGKNDIYDAFENTLFPEGLETVPPCFAISRRNKWMLKQADYVITYIDHSFGGAYTHSELAKRQGKIVINLAHE